MRRLFSYGLAAVLLLMVVGVGATSSRAQEATPTAGGATPVAGSPVAASGSPVAVGGSPVASPLATGGGTQACPDPGEVDQTYMVEDEDGGYLTVRLMNGSRNVPPWAGDGDPIARVKWGRVCIEPDAIIAAENGGDVSYPAVYVIYVEAGDLFVTLTPDVANDGYASLFDGNDERVIVTGLYHAGPGDVIVMSNATATFANRSADDTATIVAVQVAPPGDGTGCSRNCWIPSCFMPVAEQPPTCAAADESTP